MIPLPHRNPPPVVPRMSMVPGNFLSTLKVNPAFAATIKEMEAQSVLIQPLLVALRKCCGRGSASQPRNLARFQRQRDSLSASRASTQSFCRRQNAVRLGDRGFPIGIVAHGVNKNRFGIGDTVVNRSFRMRCRTSSRLLVMYSR